MTALPAPFAWRGDQIALDLEHAHVRFTTRRGGVSAGPYASLNLGPWTDDAPAAVGENRARVARLAGVTRLLQGHQVHGTQVSVEAGAGEDADGQVTARRDVAPIVLVADCLPIALVARGAVGMVHAGWRGLAGGIVARGVEAIRAASRDSDHVVAAVGPGAGGCCYEVGDEVRAAFGIADPQTPTVDLAAIAAGQLAAAGVDEVHVTGLCTLCADPELLFSHRRDGGVTGRQAGLAWRS
jgi:YfiH family protein